MLLAACLAATTIAADRRLAALPAGKFLWEPELAPTGPVVIIISLPEQTLSAYRNGIRIAYSSISSGRKGRSTPAGVFTILEKEEVHFSSKYHHAPMPFMQRLTWQGVAMHGGDLPGYPASHGCIRLPRDFAKKLYSVTTRGTTVIVVDEKTGAPTFTTHPGILLAGPRDNSITRPLHAAFEWNPERSPEGPITILASGSDSMLYVYRNGVPIGRGVIAVDHPERPLGSHAFIMLEGLSGVPSAFVPDRPGHNWMAIRTSGSTTLARLARRVRVVPEFARVLYDIVAPGTTILVTDAPAAPAASPRPLMEALP